MKAKLIKKNGIEEDNIRSTIKKCFSDFTHVFFLPPQFFENSH